MSNKKIQMEKLQSEMAKTGFWDNPDAAQKVVSQISFVKSIVEPAEELEQEISDLKELFELALAESDQNELRQLEEQLALVEKKCSKIELAGLLSRPEDTKNCFFGIHAGAGGTESCDWASMLLRMYTRYFE